MVSEGIDLAVRIGKLGDHPDLVARQLGNQRLLICATPGYLRRKGSPRSRAELVKHDCLIGWYRAGRPLWNLTTETGETEGCEIKPRHEIPDGDALLNACLFGCGLAQLPNWLANAAISDGSLVAVLGECDTTMPINVVWQKTWHTQPKVRVAVDELIELSAKHPETFAGV
jgi:DNA-binding transcriptional LysR family regulator